jgi:PAS domain S-box-containing protein
MLLGPVLCDWDLRAGEMRWSASAAELVRRPTAQLSTDPAWWRSHVHPEDLPRLDDAVRKAVGGDSQRWSCRYRVRCADGSCVAVLERGVVLHHEGRPARAIVVVQTLFAPEPDAGEQASLWDRISQSERQFRTFVEFIPQLAWSATADGWIDFYNQRWFDYTGTTLEQMEGWAWVLVHDLSDLHRMLKVWGNALAAGQPWEDEFRLRRGSDGMLRWHLSRAMPLRDATGQIVRWFGTNTDVHDQKLAMEEYSRLLVSEQRARREAEAANHAKDEFLAMISHELRTPLNAVLGWAQLLRSGAVGPGKRDIALEKIEINAQLQARLIEDLLDVSRIIAGKLQVELSPTDIGLPVRRGIDAMKPSADAKRLLLQLHDEAPGVLVLGNAGRLQQVVSNLVHNAVKFTPEGRRVDVHIRRRGDRVAIDVRDEGEGIQPAFLPHLFERFSQADRSSTRKHRGLGLGLSIVRQLVVELHRGDVTVESEGEGKGATFTVHLPVLSTAELEATSTAAAHAVETQEPAPGSAVPLVGIKVLGVDDESSAREVLAEMLLSCGATVTLASSVHEAMRAFKCDRPDVVISDIAMPESDGHALVSKIRALPDPRARHTPVIALTAYASLQDRERAMRMGFDAYLHKPVDPGRLSRLIADTFHRRLTRSLT